MGVDLEVWGGTVDIVVPFYAKGELASETRPLDAENIDIEVRVRYQRLYRHRVPATPAHLMPAIFRIDSGELNRHCCSYV